MTTPNREARIVCVRYPAADLDLIEAAMGIMGTATISQFTRTASVTLARAIVEADLTPGETVTSAWLEGTLEHRTPEGES